ncbi:MAG: hypothetical protein HYY15_01480 [Candidatus Omnitrophica bacterium]|nr:hypothetical protein [Candidatus Omnitrophota bacterium]
MARIAKATMYYGVLSLGAGVILVGVGECAARIALRLSGRISRSVEAAPSQYQGKAWVSALQREEAAVNRYDYHPYVIWRRAPYAGEAITIEPGGLRRTTPVNCDDRSSRIYMFGGSALWGTGSPDWGTIPSHVARALHDAGRPACVRNYGESAWVSRQEILQLMRLLAEGDVPDLAIFYDGWNEISARYQNGLPDAHANLYDVKQKFERSPARLLWQATGVAKLYDRVATQLRLRKPYLERHRLREEPSAEVPASIRQRYLANVEIVDALSTHYGFKYAFFWQPMILAEEKVLTEEERRIVEVSSVHPDLTQLARETYRLMKDTRHPHFAYFGDVFEQVPRTVYLDWVHVDPDANRLVALRMLELVKQRRSLAAR